MNSFFLSALTVLSLSLVSACATNPNAERELSDSERTSFLLKIAAANLTEGDPTGALENLLQVKEIDPSIPETHYLLALAYHQKSEPELALQSAKEAVRLRPTYSRALNTLGKIQFDLGLWKEAEKNLLLAAKDLTFRDAYVAKTNLGVLYLKQLKHDLALSWLDQAIRDGKSAACMASYYRGQVYLEKNKIEKAHYDFREASKNNCSQFASAHLGTAKSLVRMKKYDQARAKLLEVKQLFPHSDEANQANQYLKEIP